jgi:hypothetical protein
MGQTRHRVTDAFASGLAGTLTLTLIHETARRPGPRRGTDPGLARSRLAAHSKRRAAATRCSSSPKEPPGQFDPPQDVLGLVVGADQKPNPDRRDDAGAAPGWEPAVDRAVGTAGHGERIPRAAAAAPVAGGPPVNPGAAAMGLGPRRGVDPTDRLAPRPEPVVARPEGGEGFLGSQGPSQGCVSWGVRSHTSSDAARNGLVRR